MIKLLRFLKPAGLSLIFVVILAIGQASANLYLPNLMSDIVNKGIAAFNTNYIWRTGGIMALVAIVGTICAIAGIFFSSRIANGMGQRLRAEIFTKIQHFSLHEFDHLSTASLITRTTNDTTQIQQLIVMTLSVIITTPITLIVGIILALDQDVGLSWILVAMVPILVIIVTVLLSKTIPLFTTMQTRLDKLNLILNENLTGVRVIRAFNRIKHEEHRFNLANLNVANVAIRVNQLIATMMPIIMLLINMSTVAIIWFGSHRVAGGHLEIGAMFAFLQYAVQILFSLLMLAVLFIMIPRAEASAKRINEILELKPDIKDPKKELPATHLRGVVEFKNVTFSYHGAERSALTHITFTASPGRVTAIIGGTGSGKSTLVNLIPRFYDVQEGQILVDAIDVRQMTQATLRAKIGFVPQKPILFSGTVADNIRYGKKNATLREITHAAEIAQAIEFISKMADGFNAHVAQGGTNLSGGQIQRLSIARALVRQPEIYIFDDAFSALDFKTDAKLRSALKQETQNSTTIIVAQRVSTVMDADQIIVLDNGQIVGLGTHKQLLQTCRVYKDIVSSQLSAAEIKESL